MPPQIPQPTLYLPNEVKPAYQLRWTLALFGRQPLPLDSLFSGQLAELLEPDGIRVLNWTTTAENVALFFLSTRPSVVPVSIVQRVKGRWQHLIHGGREKVFRRNFSLESVGDPSRLSIEGYLDRQLDRHEVFEPETRRLFERFQVREPRINLASWRYVAHGRYRLNLHLTLVHWRRRQILDEPTLQKLFDAVMRALRGLECQASRVAMLPDHEHLTVRLKETCAPETLALSVMNEVARSLGRGIYGDGYYSGTFGEWSDWASVM